MLCDILKIQRAGGHTQERKRKIFYKPVQWYMTFHGAAISSGQLVALWNLTSNARLLHPVFPSRIFFVSECTYEIVAVQKL